MSELTAVRKKTKDKKKSKPLLDDEIPDLPDLSQIEIVDNTVKDEIEQNVETETANIIEKVEEINEVKEQNIEKNEEIIEVQDQNAENQNLEDKHVEDQDEILEDKDQIMENQKQVTEEFNNENELNLNVIVGDNKNQISDNLMEIDKLYPSLTFVLEENNTTDQRIVNAPEEQNSIDVVTEAVINAEAPIQEWVLPQPMPLAQLLKYCANNPLLDSIEILENEITKEMSQVYTLHPLSVLIHDYQRGLQSCLVSESQLNSARKDGCGDVSYLWSLEELTEFKQGRCRDNFIVKSPFTYTVATFDTNGAQKLEKTLADIVGHQLDSLIMSTYECGLRKALVNDYLARIKEDSKDCVTRDVGDCLLVLFSYLRQPSHHIDLTNALKSWIKLMGGIICSYGTKENRLALLWQLLHCPPGIGSWASGLIQWSNGSNRKEEEDLALAGLKMLLGGRMNRHKFLSEWNPSQISQQLSNNGDSNNDSTGDGGGGWTIVDSEGEDDADEGSTWFLLRESDIVAFLDQVPIGRIFKKALQALEDNQYDPRRGCNPNNLLSVMGFCMKIIDILEHGLRAYNNARYRQLNKRIARLIKHTIQFLTDHIECVLATVSQAQYNHIYPNYFTQQTVMAMLAQYESIHRCGMKSILAHRNHENWQCLPDMPTRLLSPLYKIELVNMLVGGIQQLSAMKDICGDGGGSGEVVQIQSSQWYIDNLQINIEVINCQTDCVYLLTCLSNIATDCRMAVDSENQLMVRITGLLFEICYVTPATRITYAKLGRELLSTICLKHPTGISVIIENLKLWHPSVGQMGIFLLRELPICFLQPSDAEFRLLSTWLIEQQANSVCNQLARYILLHLNWGFASTDQSTLYLPLSMHQRMAALLVTCYRQHGPTSAAGSGSNSYTSTQTVSWVMTESMKLIQSLWWSTQDAQDVSITTWCLSLAARLRLHPNQRPRVTDPRYLISSTVILSPEWENIFTASQHQMDRLSNPLAMYIAAVCREDNENINNEVFWSLDILNSLITRHNQYRLSLELLTTLLNSPAQLTILLSHELFKQLWRHLIHADDTYYNMAKSLISNRQFPGPVLSCLGNQYCPSIILAVDDHNQKEELLRFFLNATVDQSNWYQDISSIWLIDKLLEIDTTLELTVGDEVIYKVVSQHHERQLSDASKRSAISQLLNFRGSNQYSPITQLLTTDPSTEYECIWLRAYLLQAHIKLEMQYEYLLWPVMCQKILTPPKNHKRKDSTIARRSAVAALNSTVKNLKLPVAMNLNSLAVVQAAQSIALCPPSHLGLIKLCSIFFPRFLSPAYIWHQSLYGAGSVGYLLFQDDTCHSVLLKCRATIAAARLHFSTLLESTNQSDLSRIDQLKSLTSSLETLLLWIDEPRLHMPGVDLTTLPYDYRPDILSLMHHTVSSNNSQDNYECIISIDCSSLNLPRRWFLEDLRKSASQWTSRHDLDQRFLKLAEASMKKPFIPLHIRLFQRFQRQNSITLKDPPLASSNPDTYKPTRIPAKAIESPAQTLNFIKGPLQTLNNCVSNYRRDKSFLSDINKRYMMALSRHYEIQNVNSSVQVPCTRAAHGCTGHATVNLNYRTSVLQSHITNEINRNRTEFNQLLDAVIKFESLGELIKCILQVEHLIRKLDERFQTSNSNTVLDSALELFFLLGKQLNLENQKYPPHKHLISTFMDTLGAVFLPHATNQAPKLLQGMLENSLLVDAYISSFIPTTDVMYTAQMYLDLMKAYNREECASATTMTILSKFNINHFLGRCTSKTLKLDLIDAVCTSLTFMSVNRSNEADNHMDNGIEKTHIDNLIILINSDFNVCIIQVLARFRKEIELGTLNYIYWEIVVGQCIKENISKHGGEMAMTIDELCEELNYATLWFNNCRSNNSYEESYYNGLYSYGEANNHNQFSSMKLHVEPMLREAYDLMLDSLMFKLARAASSDNMDKSWKDAIGKGWDYFLRVYIPWLQAFPKPDNSTTTSYTLCFPWRMIDTEMAVIIMNLAVSRLDKFLTYIPVPEAQSHLMLCILMWSVNGLLCGQKELPSKPYHEVYCTGIIKLRWQLLLPSYDCVQQFFEVFMKSWASEQSKHLIIKIASDIKWMDFATQLAETGFISYIFDFIVTVICKTKNAFQIASLEQLIEGLMDLNWTNLPVSNYKKGMSQIVANLKPSIILCNETTIEGKIIKLLNRASGKMTTISASDVATSQKLTIYVETVVRLLSVAFSFTQTSSSGGDSHSNSNSQTRMFQLRVGTLFDEIEQVVTLVNELESRQNLALSMLAELLHLYRSPSICQLALEPALSWIQESSGDSPIILPLMIALYRWPPQIVPLVSFLEQLLRVYMLSEKFDGSVTSWITLTSFANLSNEMQQQQMWTETVRQSAIFCLCQQTMVASKQNSTSNDRLLARLVEGMSNIKMPNDSNHEKILIILVMLMLRMIRTGGAVHDNKPSNSLKNAIMILSKLSESKKSSGLLGKVGLGRKSSISIELRILFRCICVFLQAQVPSNNLVRTAPIQPGAITHPDMTITTRPPGEPLPSNKTMQSLEWLKNQRQSKEITTISTKRAVEDGIRFICNPSNCIMECLGLLRLLCEIMWPNDKLLSIVHISLDSTFM